MRIGIIGLGLIGGSMAIDLRKRGFATHIVGADNNKLHAQTAERLGIVDSVASINDVVNSTDIIILAIPADATIKLLPEILDRVENQVVTDVCSIKGNVCERIKNHSKRANFVAAHPMAGTEHSGPWAAVSGMFDGKAVILCDCEQSSDNAIKMVRDMYETLYMRSIYMNSHNHDIHAAYVSHISHISSFALALTVLEKESNDKNIFDMASGGFSSTVRLAKSSAEMWEPIFNQNSENVLTVLDEYIKQLNNFKTAIKSNNKSEVMEMISSSNRIIKILSS